MNEYHLRYLASPEWASTLRDGLLPWVLGSSDVGDDCLEVGPGPGVTTDLLRSRALRVTAVELDTALAQTLADRLAGTNVEAVNADATNMPFEADRFSCAVCLTMLHHMPSAAPKTASSLRSLASCAPEPGFSAPTASRLPKFGPGTLTISSSPSTQNSWTVASQQRGSNSLRWS
jgi:SAM-dependent methyltransferase